MEDYKKHIGNLLKNSHGCNDGANTKIVDIFTIHRFANEQVLFEERAKNKYIGIICEGVVKFQVLGSNGNENILFFAMEDDFVVGNLTPNMKCEFTAETITPVTILLADYKLYHNIVLNDAKLIKFHEEILDSIHSKIKGRVSKDFFRNAKENYEQFLKDYPKLLNRIPHYNIASYLGITPTQLSRIRRSFSN